MSEEYFPDFDLELLGWTKGLYEYIDPDDPLTIKKRPSRQLTFEFRNRFPTELVPEGYVKRTLTFWTQGGSEEAPQESMPEISNEDFCTCFRKALRDNIFCKEDVGRLFSVNWFLASRWRDGLVAPAPGMKVLVMDVIESLRDGLNETVGSTHRKRLERTVGSKGIPAAEAEIERLQTLSKRKDVTSNLLAVLIAWTEAPDGTGHRELKIRSTGSTIQVDLIVNYHPYIRGAGPTFRKALEVAYAGVFPFGQLLTDARKEGMS